MTAGVRATVLYEDARDVKTGQFELHSFFCACVADRVGGDIWDIRPLLAASPSKGVDKLLRTVRQDWELLRAGGKVVVAVVDDDRVRGHLGLPKDAGRQAVREAVVAGLSGHAEGFRLVLLQRNTESLLEAIASRAPDLQRLAPSIAGKSHLERDLLLSKAAYAKTPEFRRVVLQAMPSACELVDVLAELAAPPGSDPSPSAD